MAGRVQLETSGPQDAFFTDDPEYTYFIKNFQKHTNFAPLFVDLDGSPIQPIKDLPEDLQPHIIIESSPNRWHAYWLVNNCELEQFKQLQQDLAAKFNGDKAVNDLPRVMRLAGFSHNKAESFITRIRTMQDKLYPYSVNKLIVGLGLNNIRGQERSNNEQQENSPKNDDHMMEYNDELLFKIKNFINKL